MKDSDLVQAIRIGNQEAFGELVDRHHRLVYGICFRMAGNSLEAEELAHDAFVEAYLRIGQLREPAKLAGWLRTLTLNLCRMRYREKVKAAAELLDDPLAVEANDDREDLCLIARMWSGLAELPAAHRIVLALHYFEGLSYEDIATFLDVPVGTVMSRLHRARRSLRTALEDPGADEEIEMADSDEFRREVQAEIAVLLEMFRNDPKAAERLAVILRRSPERIDQLIRQTDAPAMVDNLALLLPRLGPAAIDTVLAACFCDDDELSARATVLLQRTLTRLGIPSQHGWMRRAASNEAYLVLDRLIANESGADAKARLLLNLMDACDTGGLVSLLVNMLMCFEDAAFPLLIERFQGARTRDDLFGSNAFHALCRTGRRFAEELVRLLESGDPERQALALAGLEGIARSMDRDWLEDATPRMIAEEVRRLAGGVVRREDVGDDVLHALAVRAAPLATHDRADIRNAAILVLGLLKASDHVDVVRQCTLHDEPQTRLTAIRALADLGDCESGAIFMRAAGHGELAERRAAVEAIGRLQIGHAQELLSRLADGPDAGIQDAAVTALGQIGGDDARRRLHHLLVKGSKRQRRAAAHALYRTRGPRPDGGLDEARMRRLKASDTRRVIFASIYSAIRWALPELRQYDHPEITRRLAEVCYDFATTRRLLIVDGVMTRSEGVYEFTELGTATWRVEHFIIDNYLARYLDG